MDELNPDDVDGCELKISPERVLERGSDTAGRIFGRDGTTSSSSRSTMVTVLTLLVTVVVTLSVDFALAAGRFRGGFLAAAAPPTLLDSVPSGHNALDATFFLGDREALRGFEGLPSAGRNGSDPATTPRMQTNLFQFQAVQINQTIDAN